MPVVVDEEVVVARRAAVQGGAVLAMLDAALVNAHADVQALERAREILASRRV